MFYVVYKIVNQVNGKTYVGCHKTENLNDGYLGSGVAIKNAIKKYGKENFVKEIIKIFDNEDEMFAFEKELVNENFINTNKTYNMKVGGHGGWDHVHQSDEIRYKRIEAIKKYHENNPLSNESKRKMSESLKKYYSNEQNRRQLSVKLKKAMNRPEVKEKHRLELERRNQNPDYAQKISNKLKGKIFVHHPDQPKSKRVSISELPQLLDNGWIRGRKPRPRTQRGSRTVS